MSERSTYLRQQVDKCRHAKNLNDVETQVGLRKLADEYVAQATVIEATEKGACVPPARLCIVPFEGRPRGMKASPDGSHLRMYFSRSFASL
jgi:hypothetical protein